MGLEIMNHINWKSKYSNLLHIVLDLTLFIETALDENSEKRRKSDDILKTFKDRIDEEVKTTNFINGEED